MNNYTTRSEAQVGGSQISI